MPAGNYKHQYCVEIDVLQLNEIKQWLKCLVKGQDWSFDNERRMIITWSPFGHKPIKSAEGPYAVWFNEEKDAVAFKLAFGNFKG